MIDRPTERTGRRRHGGGWVSAVLLPALLAACSGRTPPPAPPGTVTAGPTSIAHAPEIRFALVGQVTKTNVWELFDRSGYSYDNYAVRSGYWPRLYDLSLPDYKFQEVAASGPPSPVRQEGGFYTATVTVKPDLKWSDGAPFSAEDVAFTANTAIAFQLGFDWQEYYNPTWLDHVEAVDARTVKYYFKQAPNVSAWQYGVLQGPVVQDRFWGTKVAGASTLLPSSELIAQIATLNAKVADLEKQVGVLNYTVITSQGEGARVTQSRLKRQIGDLDQAINDRAKAQDEFDSAISAARSALYGLDDRSEPLLGEWLPIPAGASTSTYQNKPNAAYPGAAPHFDRAVYKVFATRAAADSALAAGNVDVVLDPASSAAGANSKPEVATLMKSPTRGMRFLVINTQSGILSSQAVRQALACVIDQDQLAGALEGQGVALRSYVSPQEADWYNPDAALPCQGLDATARLTQAAQMLKSAGFTWAQEPTTQAAGSGLKGPDGKAALEISLLASTSDPARGAAAEYIQTEARKVGIPVSAQPVSDDVVNFDVFSSHRYDMALLGWKTSLYPGYLCDWFGAGRPFQYAGSDVVSACGELNATSSIDTATTAVSAIQKSLAQDVPFIPLYSEARYEVRANVNYPFEAVLGGLAEVYGAPNLAFPQSP